MQKLTDALIKNLRDPKAIFNVVVLDMQGIIFRYTETQGINFVDTITPEQGKEGEEIYLYFLYFGFHRFPSNLFKLMKRDNKTISACFGFKYS